MNLVTNNCISGFVYKSKNIQYKNPFVWGLFDYDNYLKLCLFYNTLNFNRIKIDFDDKCPSTDVKESYYIKIDDKIKLYYIHCKLDKNCLVPTKKGHNHIFDIFCNDPIKYLKEKYFLRLKRMKETPYFVYVNADKSISRNQIQALKDNNVLVFDPFILRNFPIEIRGISNKANWLLNNNKLPIK